MVIIFVLLLLSSAHAQFSGKYLGKGQAVFSSSKIYACEEIFLNLQETPEYFRLKEGGYSCKGLHASFDPYRFLIKKGGLWHNNIQYGTISSHHLEYRMFDPEDGSTYHLQLIKNQTGQITYQEEWFDGNRLALTVEGTLDSVP